MSIKRNNSIASSKRLVYELKKSWYHRICWQKAANPLYHEILTTPRMILHLLLCLICGLLTTSVVALGPSLIADKFRFHTLGGSEALLLGALDTVTVRLVGLVAGCVVLLLDHDCLSKQKLGGTASG